MVSEAKEYLTIQGISLRRKKQDILKDITFSVQGQEIMGIIGPNGAGKSTLFDIITGFIKPSRGKVVFKNTELTKSTPHKVRHLGISRTFQIAHPFGSMTTLENVMVALMFGKVKVKETENTLRNEALRLLDIVGLAHKQKTPARCLTLSEQRKLEVARALAPEPEVLLLDEFAAGLSPKAIDNALQLIEKLRDKGLTLIIIDHFLNVTSRLSDRMIALDRGRMIAMGKPSEVLGNPLVASAYLGKKNDE